MQQITLEVPDPLGQRLARLAAEQKKSVEEVAVEQLESVLKLADASLKDRNERFLKGSGLFVEVPEEERQRYQPASDERLKELAAKLAVAGPLSAVILEDRGKL